MIPMPWWERIFEFVASRGLRVADASIMPNVPAGNTNAASIMIGGRAADLIIWTSPTSQHA